MTIDSLKAFGANTAEGLARCMNNEAFYMRMVGMVLADKNFDKLKTAMEAGDVRSAFEAAHALKGTTGNVSLTPLYVPVCTLTDLLRDSATIPAEAAALVDQILEKRQQALAL